jgi:hypothetical protein
MRLRRHAVRGHFRGRKPDAPVPTGRFADGGDSGRLENDDSGPLERERPVEIRRTCTRRRQPGTADAIKLFFVGIKS